jgi:VanZ family protein
MKSGTPPPSPPRSGEGSSLSPPSLLGKGAGGLGSYLHLAVFVTLLSVWTWKLLEPRPVPESVVQGMSRDAYLVASKCAHAGAYAVLAVLALTVPRRRWRPWLLGLVVLHGAGSELAQYLMAVGRTGKVTDVLLDWAGVAAGVVAVWWWGRKRPLRGASVRVSR